MRLRALWSRASNPVDEVDHEADSARLRFQKLCQKYDLAPSATQATIETGDPKLGAQTRRIRRASSALWRMSLAWALQDYTHCYVVKEAHHKGEACYFWLSGEPSDMDRFMDFYERFEAEIEADAVAYMASLPAHYDRGDRRSAGDSFRKGEAAGIWKKFARLMREAEEAKAAKGATPGVTPQPVAPPPWDTRNRGHLTLVGRQLAAKDAYKNQVGGTTTTYNVSASRADAYNAGVRKGEGKSVHRGVLR